MKKYIKSTHSTSINVSEQNTIHVVMYLHPTIYSDSLVVTSSIHYNNNSKKYETDVNPYREINGPLSNYGEELESPIKEEYEGFIKDCVDLIEMYGFIIIDEVQSTDSKKSRYILLFGMNDQPCGKLVFDLRISDHPFDAEFPDDFKEEALEYLKMNNVLDETATSEGINFSVEKVTVGSVKHDTWNRAFSRLGDVLDKMRRKIRKQINIDKSNI